MLPFLYIQLKTFAFLEVDSQIPLPAQKYPKLSIILLFLSGESLILQKTNTLYDASAKIRNSDKMGAMLQNNVSGTRVIFLS